MFVTAQATNVTLLAANLFEPNEPSRGPFGHYVKATTSGEEALAFVPNPLPPDLDLRPLAALLEGASEALGRLDGLASALPETELFIYLFVRKEAVLSSQIEGTQSSLSELLLFEESDAPGVPPEDIAEVSGYVRALYHGVDRLRESFPLSLRLLRETHAELLRNGRGSDCQPGEFRKAQNWIGGTRPGNAIHVPPPPDLLPDLLRAFESFLNLGQSELPRLIRAGLAHAQFETIHPFLDGNGRLGRLLITLLLVHRGDLQQPLLYLSLFFKTRRAEYYALLNRVRSEGAWLPWLEFFLTAVRETSREVIHSARRLQQVADEDRHRIQAWGRPAGSALRVHQWLVRRPVTSVEAAAGGSRLSPPSVARAFSRLRQEGIVEEITGRQRGRLYSYKRYMGILNEGAEPLPRG